MYWPWRSRTRDHRGRHTVIPNGLNPEAIARDARLSPRARERIAAHLRRDEALWSAAAKGCAWEFFAQVLLVPLTVILAVLWWWLIARHWPRSVALILSISGVAAAFFLAEYLLNRWTHRPDRERVIGALLGEGLCPSCGYEIKAVPPQADGCVVCPECGAAWLIPQAVPQRPGSEGSPP